MKAEEPRAPSAWGPRATYDHYKELFSEYESAVEQIEQKLADYLESQGLKPEKVTSRPKSPVSLYKKQLKKNYADPWTECKDLLGVRVIVSLSSDKQKVRLALESESSPFQVEKIEDKEETRQYLSLTYGGLHMDLTDDSPSDLLGERIGFEVQIRSIAEHTWAETEHSYIYKGPTGVPDRTKRQFARVLALVELMDMELDRGVEAVSKLETYGWHVLALSLAEYASDLSLPAGSKTITEENIEELCRVLGREPRELEELTRSYIANNVDNIHSMISSIGPDSSSFDIDRHLLLAQPELLLVAALIDDNKHAFANALVGSHLRELVLPIARHMGHGRLFRDD